MSIERVVIQLDPGSETRDAVDTAARLAALARAPLRGIFIEDKDLLSLATLPFACQVTLGAGREPLTVEHVERQLQVAAERARRDLATATERHGVGWSFEIVREPLDRALSGTSERDLVVAAALTRPVAGQFRLECRWWASISAAPGPLFLVRHAWETSGGVVILLGDQSDGSARLLEAAARIAKARNANPTVLSAVDAEGAEDIEAWAADHLARHSVPLQIERVPTEAAALHRRMLELDCRLLAVEARFVENRPDRIRKFVDRVGCDLLVVH
jgi:nucleotide-binding universal stress UspA family protein